MAGVVAALLAWLTSGLSIFVDKVLQPLLMPLVQADLVPDFLIRFGIRLMLGGLLTSLDKGNPVENVRQKLDYVRDLKQRKKIAENTQESKEQHYEVPAAFYDLCLGSWKKYSCGLWPAGCETLEASEEEALRVVCERAKITNTKLRVLDVGCGWGSATLYIASHFPNVQMVAVSHSASQKVYIDTQAKKRGLKNVTVITSDINDFEAPVAEDQGGKFDRIISIEMIEHTKNWEKLFGKISSWLKPEGLFFMHIFTHKEFPFHYVDGWMAKTFFTGGQMPSDDLALYFQRDLTIQDHWIVNGKHYERTCNEWLKKLDSNREAALEVSRKVYGDKQKLSRFVDWRLFFIACAELFGYKGGNEWAVSHYLFSNKAAAGAAGSSSASSAAAVEDSEGPTSAGGSRKANRRH